MREHEPLPADTISAVQDRIAYIDVIGGRCKRNFSKFQRAALRATTMKRKRIRCKLANRPGVGEYVYRFEIFQPTDKTFNILQRIEGMYISDVERALDLICTTREIARKLGDFMQMHLVHLHSGNLKPTTIARTTYSRPRKWGRPVSAQYDDRLSKPAGLPCLHIERRETSATYLRRNGVEEPTDLLNIDHRHYWKDKLILERLDKSTLGKRILRHRRDVPTTRNHIRAADRAILRFTGTDNPTAQQIRTSLTNHSRFNSTMCMIRYNSTPLLPPEQ